MVILSKTAFLTNDRTENASNPAERTDIMAREKITKEMIRRYLQESRKSEETDDPIDRVFTEPAGLIFCQLANKLGLSPNQVSLLSMAAGIAGGIFFYWDSFTLNLIGVLLMLFSIILDCTDGQLARLTHKTSELGRVLDGVSTIVGYFVVYFALGLRMMNEKIPFTDTLWGGWVWLMIAPCTLIFHAGQDRMADYFRNLHLLFHTRGENSEFDRSEKLQARYLAEKPGLNRVYLRFYTTYTRMQEKYTPRLQRFLKTAGDDGKYPDEVREDFLRESRKYIQLTNLLTLNIRAYALFILILLNPFFEVEMHAFYFIPFLLIMQLVNYFMINRYERIADSLLKKYYSSPEESGK